MNKNRLGISLTKCYLCGGDKEIIMNTILSEKKAKEIEAMNGQVIDREPCQKCQDYMKQGIIVITYDTEKSKDAKSADDLYRDGGFYVVKEHALDHLMENANETGQELLREGIKKRVLFLPSQFFEN